jgi:hypothetical protein
MVHVAGGVFDDDGFFLDTHAHAVSEEVFGLVEQLLARTGPVPLVLERDGGFPPFPELRAEVDRLRALLAAASEAAPRAETKAHTLDAASHEDPALAGRQATLARLLTDVAPPSGEAAAAFGGPALARTRAVLEHKRVDDAWPLLPRIAAAGERARELALHVVRTAARAPQAAGIVDALRIADAAAADPELAPAARRDRLELRSRFARRRPERCAPRRGPFVGRERLPDGHSVWAVKSIGWEAPVRLIERGGRS